MFVLVCCIQAEFEEEEEELQKDIEKIRSQKTALDTELRLKKDTMVRIDMTVHSLCM